MAACTYFSSGGRNSGSLMVLFNLAAIGAWVWAILTIRSQRAGVFDYIDLLGWQCVALVPDVPKDLGEIDDEAHRSKMSQAGTVRTAADRRW